MSNSMSYWNTSENVRDRLKGLAEDAINMHIVLENNDSPGELAEELASIEKGLLALAKEIGPNVTAIRKIGEAFDGVPGVKA